MRREASELLETVGLSCRPDDRLGALRTSEQQLVEIARALSSQARVLIMDEPTAALSQREVGKLVLQTRIFLSEYHRRRSRLAAAGLTLLVIFA